MFEISTGDALSFARDLDTDSQDCVLTGPPYCAGGLSENSRKSAKCQGIRSNRIREGSASWFAGDNMGFAGLCFLLRSLAFEAARFLKPGGSFLVFCDWKALPLLAPAIESAGLRWVNLIVWDKGGMGLGKGFRTQHELVLHYTKGVGVYHDKSVGNVIVAKRVHHTKRDHQAEKPGDLLSSLLKVASPPGGSVVDFFVGSGAIGEAALSSGRSFYGTERDPIYVEIALKRLFAVEV